METVSKQEYMRILSELDLLTTKFVALEQENHKLLGDLQQVSVEKAQQHEELSKRVQQLEAIVLSLRQQASTSQSLLKEPKISLPTKFDGTRSQFRGFLNQVRLIIHMHPNRYPTDATRVGLVGTLLTGTALAWFAPLLEKKSPILENFDTFINEFQASFGDTDSVRTTINKIRRLRQGDRPASAYAADFRLLACDIPWDEAAMMDLFRHGLRNDVKDLLLTFHDEPKSLTEAISRAVRCDNRLFERRSERQQTSTRLRSEQTYASALASPPLGPMQVPNPNSFNGPTPMEIDAARRRGPLSEAEKQRRRANRLCLYCGGPGHIAIHCPHRPKRQLNQVSAIENFDSCSPVKANKPRTLVNNPQSNSFDVLSQLDELLNE